MCPCQIDILPHFRINIADIMLFTSLHDFNHLIRAVGLVCRVKSTAGNKFQIRSTYGIQSPIVNPTYRF